MATATLIPNGASSDGAWTPTGAATLWQATSDGADGTYAKIQNGDNTFLCTFTNLPGGASTVTSLTSTYRISRSTGWNGDILQLISLGGTSESAYRTPTTSFANWSDVLAKPGGGTFTVQNIADTLGGCTSRFGTIAEEGKVSELSWSVVFQYGQGAFAHMVGSLVGAAMGFSEMSGLARVVNVRDRVLISPEEYVELWQDIQEWRRPAYFFLRQQNA